MNSGRATVLQGLISDTHQIITAGTYHMSARTTVLFGSGLVITLSQTGSQTVSVTTPPTSAQTDHIDISTLFNCAVGDILHFAATSVANADQPPSFVTSTINLRNGL